MLTSTESGSNEDEIQGLVQAAQQGDADSAGMLFECLVDRIFRFIVHRAPTPQIAEDLTQTVFLEMLQALPRYKRQKDAKFTTWLFQIARFRLIDFYRKQKTESGLDEVGEIASEPHLADPVMSDTVNDCLRKLPERYATVLELRFRQDLSVDETALILKTTTTNVRVIQHRALKSLRKLLPPDLI